MKQFDVHIGNITSLEVDVIVNAASRSLRGGGGVDGAIRWAAGPQLDEECLKLGGCEVGQSKVTRGYDLPARWVIHTVGPKWKGGGNGERKLLENCYQTAMAVADSLPAESIAFPLISTGAYGYPSEEGFDVAVESINHALNRTMYTNNAILCLLEPRTISQRGTNALRQTSTAIFETKEVNPYRDGLLCC